MDLKESNLLRESVAQHWYYRSKAEFVARTLRGRSPRTVLDIGAGSGFFSRWLMSRTALAEAWCIDLHYERDRDEAVDGKAMHFRRELAPVDADLVLLMDVLEHVDDDLGLLRAAVRSARDDAAFLVSVPAFQFMWSGHDVFLEHKRRYTLAQLEALARAAGLRVCAATYFFAGVFPIAMLVRLPRKLLGLPLKVESGVQRHSRLAGAVLRAVSWAELRLLRRNRWFGLTACVLAERDPQRPPG